MNQFKMIKESGVQNWEVIYSFNEDRIIFIRTDRDEYDFCEKQLTDESLDILIKYCREFRS